MGLRIEDCGLSDEDAADLTDVCEHLNRAFERVLDVVCSGSDKNPFEGASQWMTEYTKVFNLCTANSTHKEADTTEIQRFLYEKYREMLTNYLAERKTTAHGKTSDQFLKEVVTLWQNHKVILHWQRRMFQYLDRFYTTHQNGLDDLRSCGLRCFFSEIYTSITGDLRKALFEHIQRERDGRQEDRLLLREAISLFVEMGKGDKKETLTVYSTDFEKPFLEFTGEYYEREAIKWIAEDSATEYMKKAERRLDEELQRAEAYLHRNSDKVLTQVVEEKLLTAHQRTLLEMENSGFIALLRDQRLEDISRCYRLFRRISKGLEPIAQLVYEFATNEGKQIVSKHSNTSDLCFKAYTNDLLELHAKYRSLLKNQLDNPVFEKAVKDAFEAFVNQQLQCTIPNAPAGTAPAKVCSAELLANYCDMLMKNATEKMADNELEDVLEQVVAVFGYINDKDLFQEFYRKQLSKRLLMTKVNDESERSLISKLKLRQGAPFTSRLEGMLQDKNLSHDLQAKFKGWLTENNVNFGFEYSVQVLTTGSWPAFQIHTLNVPPQCEKAMEKFKMFYNIRTQSRKLCWVHSLGTVTLDALFNKQKFQLQMTTFQACVLLLFNANDEYTGKDLMKELGLPWDEVRKALQSLAMGKYKILLKKQSPKGGAPKAVDEEDTFAVNVAFTDKSRKLKIPTVVAKVNLKNSQQVTATVEEDRRHAIEACIVRIMKKRKQMEHPALVTETISQLHKHFQPDPRHIKKRIEDLIAREYIQRDDEKHSLYRYMA